MKSCTPSRVSMLLIVFDRAGWGDPQPGGGPAEVQVLGDGDEIPQLPRLKQIHSLRLSLEVETVLDGATAAEM
jgi:hypothetical protein